MIQISFKVSDCFQHNKKSLPSTKSAYKNDFWRIMWLLGEMAAEKSSQTTVVKYIMEEIFICIQILFYCIFI